jgi:hypothetical protein
MEIRKTHDDWIVVNGDKHAHFKNRRGCQTLLRLLSEGKMPRNHYFRVAAQRLLSESEIDDLADKTKPRYVRERVR